MAISQLQKDNFVYWATQYIKMKCIGAKIREITYEKSFSLSWVYLAAEREAGWFYGDILKAEKNGSGAQKDLIKSQVQPAVPELWPDLAPAESSQ